MFSEIVDALYSDVSTLSTKYYQSVQEHNTILQKPIEKYLASF